jgi:hypothetical protein
MSTVYRKTAKGQAEIDTRAHRLLPRLRQALILVDGRKTDAELAKLILAEPEATLATLQTDGFIEAIATVVDAPPERKAEAAAPAAASGAPARKAVVSVDAIRRDAVRFLNDQLGPAAEGISIKLERVKTMPELRPLLVSAAQLIVNVRGADAAQAFAARFLSDEEA